MSHAGAVGPPCSGLLGEVARAVVDVELVGAQRPTHDEDVLVAVAVEIAHARAAQHDLEAEPVGRGVPACQAHGLGLLGELEIARVRGACQKPGGGDESGGSDSGWVGAGLHV